MKYQLSTKLQSDGWEVYDHFDSKEAALNKALEMCWGPLGFSCMYQIVDENSKIVIDSKEITDLARKNGQPGSTERPLYVVAQPKGTFLCGQCCLATLGGVTLDEAIAIVGHRNCTSTKMLQKALLKMGFKVSGRLRRITKNTQLPLYAIGALRKKGQSGGGHWVVLHRGEIRDSLAWAQPVPKAYRLVSYMEVNGV